MIDVSNEYKEAMDKRIRNRAYILVEIGAINQKAQKSAVLSTDAAYWSKGNVFNGNAKNIEYATLESDFLRADGSMYFMPEEDDEVNVIRANGITTKNLLGSAEIKLDDSYEIKGLTIEFGNTYPTRFKVETDSGIYEYENSSSIFVTKDVLGDISHIIITPLEMAGKNQRLRIKRILLGVGLEYSNSSIKSFNLKEDVSPISDELPSQHVGFSFYDPDNNFNVEDDNSFIDYMETQQVVTTSFGIELDDGTVDWNQIATSYLSEISSKNGIVTVSAYDRLYHMEDAYSLGYKIYKRSAYDEALSIFTDAGLSSGEYYIDEYLKKITLENPMPICSHKECLQILANACRCKVRQNENGVTMIVPNFGAIIDRDYISVSTNGYVSWSNPSDIITGSDTVYAELLPDFIKADGSMRFLPENEDYQTTGYVSASISDDMGFFETEPKIEISFTEKVSYYGITLEFAGNLPKEFIIQTYLDEKLLSVTYATDIQSVTAVNSNFSEFDKMVITFIAATPNSRIILNKLTFGALSDYVLTKRSMKEMPTGFKEKRVKELMVKIYSYQLDEDGEIEEVEDSVFFTKNINKIGETKVLLNPLISTEEHASMIAEWIGNHYANNVLYDVSYRGDPRLNATDIIRMESEILDNLQVEITSHNLSFNGAFSGSMSLRRAYNMTKGAL